MAPSITPSHRSIASSGFPSITRAVTSNVPSRRTRGRDSKSTLVAILPTYNEAGNLKKLLAEMRSAFDLMDVDPVVVIVDDDSPDKTADEAERVFQDQKWPRESYVVLRRPNKDGLGSAYRFATTFIIEQLSESKKADYILIMDSDLSHSPADIPRLWNVAMPSSVAVASRYADGGTVGNWSFLRRAISSGANLVGRVALRVPVNDCTGSFRIYSANVWENVVPRTKCNGFGFQVEALALASFMGYSFVEVPITFNEREYGKSKMSFMEVVRFLFVIIRMIPFILFGRLLHRLSWSEAYRRDANEDVTSHGYDSLGEDNEYELSSSFLPSVHSSRENLWALSEYGDQLSSESSELGD